MRSESGDPSARMPQQTEYKHQMKLTTILIASLALAGGAFSEEKKYKEGGCCDKAAKKGEKCAHPCCVAAEKDGKVCEKCNKK
jgi:hypothetical protein